MRKREAGFLAGLEPLLLGGVAAAFLLGCFGCYWWGYAVAHKAASIAAKAEKAAALEVQAERARQSVALVTRLVQEGLDKQATIDSLAASIKAKGVQNDTAKLCPAAPAGSTLITAERLRELKALYK